MRKDIRELAWNVTEAEYRQDSAYSYSKLAAFATNGARALQAKPEEETDALKFGSLVDCLLTEPDTFKERFVVGSYVEPPKSAAQAIKYLIEKELTEDRLEDISESLLLEAMDFADYCSSYKKASTRIGYLVKYQDYYKLKLTIKDKILITQEDYNDAIAVVETLRTHQFTSKIFGDDKADHKDHYYQLKFKTKILGIDVRCMLDKVIVDHEKKIIYPKDLKTTGFIEESFEQSILKWRYDIQATLYGDIIREVIKDDPYFKDFEVAPFEFICINRYSKSPICWRYLAKQLDPWSSIIREDESLITWQLDRKGYYSYSWLLPRAAWHDETGIYNYPRDIYLNEGKAEADLTKFL